jgi:hypothetical protein
MKPNRILSILWIFLIPWQAFPQTSGWFRGNTHSHTTRSDGDVDPATAAAWYRTHGYQFLVISDHNSLTNVDSCGVNPADPFILIPGEEISDVFGRTPVHLNAIGISRVLPPKHGTSISEVLQKNADAIDQAGGLAQINHPNWKWSFDDKSIAGVRNVPLLEIYNVNKESNNFAAGGYPGMEEIWDGLLSQGQRIWGVMSDDSHSYTGEFAADRANPGRGWLMVRAESLSAQAILQSLEEGDFYGTTGIVLKDVRPGPLTYAIDIQPWTDAKYTTLFIGKGGRILEADHGLVASYTIRGNEGYIRAKIVASTGEFAITQPFFVP